MHQVETPVYEFGPFRLDLNKRQLLRGNEPVALTPKVFETLVALVQSKQKVVLKDDLMKTVWPDSFVEESNLSQNIFILRKALGDSQAKRYIVTVPGKGYQFTEAVRELREAKEEMVIESRSRTRVVIEETSRKPRLLWAGVGLVFVAMVGAALLFYRGAGRSIGRKDVRGSAPVVGIPGVKVRRSVAVLGFRNLSGQPEEGWLSTGLREMLDTELAAGGQLRTIPGEQVARGKLELDLPDVDSLTKESLRQIHTDLNADYVVLGSFAVVGSKGKSQLRLDLRLQDTAAGETVSEEAFTGSTEELFELVSQAGAQLRAKLGATDVPAEQVAGIRASLPSTPQAARLYAEGLAKLRDSEVLAARDLLLRATKIEPSNALAHSALAGAWDALGYRTRAQEEAKQAFELSTVLARIDRLPVEARFREVTNDYPAAIEIYRTLSQTFPDDVEYGLRLATAHIENEDGKSALQTTAKLRLIPGVRGDARIDLAEVKAHEKLGDFRAMQQAAATAATKAQAQGSRLLTAQAKEQEGWALDHLGDMDRALAVLSEAKELAQAARNPNTTGMVWYSVGTVEFDKGNYEAARKAYEESCRIFRQLGSLHNAAFAAGGVGNILFMQGKFAEARGYYEETLRAAREVGDKGGPIGSALGNLANVMVGMADLAEATRLEEESLAAFREVGNKRGEGTTLSALGDLLYERGDISSAKAMQEQAVAMARETGFRRIEAYALYNQAQIALAQDRMEDALNLGEQAMAIRKQTSEEGLVATSQLLQAEIFLRQGKAAEAEALANAAAEIFRRQQSPTDSCQAAAILTRALWEQGKKKEAQSAAAQAVSLARQVTDREPRFDAVFVAALVEENARKAMAAMQSIRQEAHKYGFFGYELDARLRLGALEIRSGAVNNGREHLQQLQKEAKAKGFLLVARLAADAIAHGGTYTGE